jgi:hypothetical protein
MMLRATSSFWFSKEVSTRSTLCGPGPRDKRSPIGASDGKAPWLEFIEYSRKTSYKNVYSGSEFLE